jgi:hypothetical protein
MLGLRALWPKAGTGLSVIRNLGPKVGDQDAGRGFVIQARNLDRRLQCSRTVSQDSDLGTADIELRTLTDESLVSMMR